MNSHPCVGDGIFENIDSKYPEIQIIEPVFVTTNEWRFAILALQQAHRSVDCYKAG
ncbi:hypothetical protein QUA13_17900 [Microcoleus sp. S28C3]|uniref:hypothetical protein n=1 Tax=Microcoleus sp. S28C3 TaxID=3055414 RepID=UPI002FCEF85F